MTKAASIVEMGADGLAHVGQQTRLIPTTGIYNLRDYGGYPCRNGRLRKSWLFRSGQHAEATDKDLLIVDQFGLHAIVDLRSEQERTRVPCRRSGGFSGRVHFCPKYLVGRAPHVVSSVHAPTVEGIRTQTTRAYRKIVFSPIMARVFALYFDIIASTAGPTMVHCAAGKDRTGIAVALLHAALGVHAAISITISC